MPWQADTIKSTHPACVGANAVFVGAVTIISRMQLGAHSGIASAVMVGVPAGRAVAGRGDGEGREARENKYDTGTIMNSRDSKLYTHIYKSMLNSTRRPRSATAPPTDRPAGGGGLGPRGAPRQDTDTGTMVKPSGVVRHVSA